MQTISVQQKKIDYQSYIRNPVKETDFSNLIKNDTLLTLDNKIILLYFTFKEDTLKVIQACKTIPYATSRRSGGLWSTSKIFGFDPATGIRKPFCSATALSWENPKEHKVITSFGKKIAEIYSKYLPVASQNHYSKAREVIKDQWLISDTPFTGGIINKNNQLNYHYDTGNFKGVFSNMIVFKSNVTGGYLSLPEFDIGLQCANNTLVMFDGQSILHGVTPIHLYSKLAYRYSIVYYTLEQFAKCENRNLELIKIRNMRNKIEKNNEVVKVIGKIGENLDKPWFLGNGIKNTYETFLEVKHLKPNLLIHKGDELGEMETYRIVKLLGYNRFSVYKVENNNIT